MPFNPPNVYAWDDAGNNRWLISGKGSAIINPPSAWAVAMRDNPKVGEQVWHHSMPRGPKGRFAGQLPFFYGIWNFSKNKQAAKDLLHYISLKARVPHLEKAFFANSGTESVEAAIKFARAATGRAGIAHCSHSFHGLTFGSLSMNGDTIFRKGFEGFLTDAVEVPFNDLAALEDVLKTKKIGGFFVEPIQGKGVNIPDDGYLKGVAELCAKYGTLFIADEIQTGVGRTGKFLAVEHWGVEPDVVLLAKALSGGHIPVGVVLTRKWIFDKLFNRMDRAVVHGSTFAKNDMAMAAALATLDVLEEEHIIENAAVQGERLLSAFRAMKDRYELIKDVRGKGLMIGVEFGAPKSMGLKMAWAAVEAANKGLFCQMIIIPLFKDHKILVQVAGHASHTIKLLPPLTITSEDCAWIENSFEAAIAEAHKVPGSVWSLGKTLAGHAVRTNAS